MASEEDGLTWRDDARKIVVLDVEIGQLSELSNRNRDPSFQRVVVQVKTRQAAQLRQVGSQLSGEPFTLQRDVDHSPMLVASNSDERAATWFAFSGPRREALVHRVQCQLDFHQRAHL
ncbi:cellulose synthase family protein [Striga asiatica]|uniref:Cellulose synthase family protein n=1 Tax=Striga asiatica TaxID=4170 RepID=A0A5A7P5G5_STRAF|nr:cellulose synthase family protein [Striga asiatica]